MYIIKHVLPNSVELYHCDTCCTCSKLRGDAKLYAFNNVFAMEPTEQRDIVRSTFGWYFEKSSDFRREFQEVAGTLCALDQISTVIEEI